jgi:T5orf172 domain
MPVYILSDHPNNRLKIGYTANVAKRLQTHRTSNPGLELVAVLEDGDRNAEKAIHRLMQGHRISGTTEWYRDSAIVRQALARVCLGQGSLLSSNYYLP